jgi:hypothetical protein
MNPMIQIKKATSLFIIIFALACLALPQTAQAVSPAPPLSLPLCAWLWWAAIPGN